MPPADPLRYSNNTREMRKTMARMPWRTRTRKKKPATHVLTPAEKQAAATASHEAKVAQNMLVTQALVDVWNVADRLHKDTGKHTAHYWYEHLVQKAGKSKKTRRPNSWNAFVSKQVKAYNDGKYNDLDVYAMLTIFLTSPSGRYASCQGHRHHVDSSARVA